MTFLSHLAKRYDLTQESFASIIGVSRPTVAKMFRGETELTLPQAQKLAGVLGITLEELVTGKERIREVVLEESKKTQPKMEERISVPAENVEKFKQALLYITQKIGALPNVGQTVLYKILYFCDFDYYEKFEEQLI
jgi:transcriptional regulator with XRE-family HTH domain